MLKKTLYVTIRSHKGELFLKTLSQKQIDALEFWKKLSQNIAKLYANLEVVELSFGKDSDAYKDMLKKIKMCLEVEDSLEEEFYFRVYSDTNILVTTYLKSEARILKRLARNIKATDFYLDSLFDIKVNFNSDILCVGLIEEFENKNEKRITDKKISLMEDSIFLNLIDKELFGMLLQEIDDAKDYRDRAELIKVRDLILNRNKSLEQWYFGISFDPTFELIDDDEFVAGQLGISLDKYRLDKKNFFKDEVRDVQNAIISKSDGYFKRNPSTATFIQLYLQFLFSYLDLSDIELEYRKFKDDVNDRIIISSDNIQCIYSIYDRFIRDFSNRVKKKKPNN